MYKRREFKIEDSAVNSYSDARDGIITRIKYRDMSGYGSETELYLCENTKHESLAIVKRVKCLGKWVEESMHFDSDSFEYLQDLLKGGGEIIRDYSL